MMLPAGVQGEARRVVAAIQELSGVVAVVIATSDGFDVANVVSRGVDAARVAAMASSISAIGAVVVQEGRLTECSHVTVGAPNGFVHVVSVPRTDVQLVINVIADDQALLGQVAYTAAEQARKLAVA